MQGGISKTSSVFSLCGIMSGGIARVGECDKICILRLFSKKDIGGRKVD